MKLLVVGAGSIGQRHAKNLRDLGMHVATVDPIKEADFTNVHTAIKDVHPDAAVIAVPTNLHMDVAIEVASHNMPIFIEKPLSHSMQGVSILKNMMDVTKQWAVIGYSLRFHPALQIIKSLLSEIGTPLYARAEVGQYLPDWHPTENYKHWYMAHEDQGGGALLDLSHELDYMMWLFGNMLEWQGTVKTISNLKIDSDDLAEVQIRYDDLKIGSIHMDLLDRAYNRSLRIIGSEATLKWEWKQSIELLQGDTHTYYGYNHNRNVQFIEEMKTFIQSVQAGYPLEPFATLADGEEILRIVLDLKEQNGR